ncbi:family 43 glycosylhydrolase [Chitinophaga lutea]
MKTTLMMAFALLLGVQAALAQTYRNPVFDHNFPDPNIVEGKDGFFYAYSTQVNWRKDSMGGPYIIPILRSKDLVNWKHVGAALEKRPSWKKEGGIWAPDVTYYRGRYLMYYSVSTWGDPNPGIGVAVSDKPEGPFEDKGKLFLSKEIGVANSIDPFFMEDKGKPYLVWGSFHGIYGVPLSKDGLSVKGDTFRIAGNLYEGAYILKRDGYYYFFGSAGTCCEGARSTYRVLVGRSRKLKGPYLDRDGRPLLERGGTLVLQRDKGDAPFVGPGHHSDIVTDKNGDTWMLYHAFHAGNDKKGRVMLLDKISWKDGWPAVEGYVPSRTDRPAPAF